MSELMHKAAELINIASVSRNETAIADLVEQHLREIESLEVIRIENNVVARTFFGRPMRLILGGHLDTVPPSGNEAAEIRGDELFGCGSADMKGGIAILMQLASMTEAPVHDVTFIFYACEEVARAESGLLAIEATDPNILLGDAAILLEPTNAIVEAGCQGVMRLQVTLGGRRAHSARPWVGINAIHRVASLLEIVAGFDERMPVIDGCTYHETLQAVNINGGVAGNVVPDEVTILLSHRFAPDRTIEEAEAAIRKLFDPVIDEQLGDELVVVDAAPAAPPSLSHELLARVVLESGSAPVAKIGWTDVAFFFERNIPAVNFGPGDPLVAHGAGEFVRASDLDRVQQSLHALLNSSSAAHQS